MGTVPRTIVLDCRELRIRGVRLQRSHCIVLFLCISGSQERVCTQMCLEENGLGISVASK